MKKFQYIVSIFFFISNFVFGQEFSFVSLDGFTKYSSYGNEVVFNLKIKNLTSKPITIFMLRALNKLPDGWSSSMCFGKSCFPMTIDSVATSSDFGGNPLQPGQEMDASLHVNSMSNNNEAVVSLQVGNVRNPDSRITLNFIASTKPNAVEEKNTTGIKNYLLSQNYPNPFNPSTTIFYSLPFESSVKLFIYNIIGEKAEVLEDAIMPAGSYKTDFNGKALASGLYFYTIQARSTDGKHIFTSTKKMMILK